MRGFFAYWGKSDAEGGYHCLPFHCLDVAAVADVLLAQGGVAGHFARLLDLPEAFVRRWLVWLVALHDLGKFTAGFQSLNLNVHTLLGKTRQGSYQHRHDTLGLWLWLVHLRPALHQQGEIRGLPPPGRLVVDRHDYWLAAVTGHHGVPLQCGSYYEPLLFQALDATCDLEAVTCFARLTHQLWLHEDDAWPEVDEARLKTASWWLAGFTILCDWLGSNREYFDYYAAPESAALEHPQQQLQCLRNYYHDVAIKAAKKVVKESGLGYAPLSAQLTLRNCLPASITEVEATPLQQHCTEVVLGDGPQLFILEDITGAGKTEAALLLVHRLMRQHNLDGFYFALPTMATANAMYSRLQVVYRHLFADGEQASLILAHSMAGENDRFSASLQRLGTVNVQDHQNDRNEQSAEARCAAWLADHRKKCLLAQAGVGTIDQALLAVLATKHQALRLFGLLGKVLLVDEVHACDDFMRSHLAKVLSLHAAAGGSAVLLSATLPHSQKEQLARAFREGLKLTEAQAEEETPFSMFTAAVPAAPILELNEDYPLVTQISSDAVTTTRVASRDSSRRFTAMTCLESEAAVMAQLEQAVAAGRCVVWIRNTVKDARESYRQLREHYPHWPVTLFHARFTVKHRGEIESACLQRFGRDSSAEQRQGQVLISTQVLEQSVDCDMDDMISDIAPIDLLIQRAGRLHRHARDAHGNPASHTDQRGTPVLYIHTPPWQDEPAEDWLKATQPGTAAVYKNMDAHLWQSLKLLRRVGGWQAPDDLRGLIEGVYDMEYDKLPAALRDFLISWQGEGSAKQSVARPQQIVNQEGYYGQEGFQDDTQATTRLGERTNTLLLVQQTESGLQPITGAGTRWIQATVTLSVRIAAEAERPGTITHSNWEHWLETLPNKGRWLLPVVMERNTNGHWRGTVKDGNGKPRTLYYSEELGLWDEAGEILE